jgi:hypothetical protein
MTTGDHFYTTGIGERDAAVNLDGYHVEQIACHVLPNQLAGSIPFYRLFSVGTDDHFYTTDLNEATNAAAHDGYQMEGVACYVFGAQPANTAPLFRLWNGHDPKHKDHFYTTSSEERDLAVAQDGYAYEAIACYVYVSDQPGETVPLWRLFNQPHPVQQARKFSLSSIQYDTADATVQSTSQINLYEDNINNAIGVSETSELDGSEAVTDSSGWSNTISSKIDTSASAKVSIPVISLDLGVTVSTEQAQSYTWNGSESYQTSWSWKQPVTVPAHSTVRVQVLVSQSTVVVPYTMQGQFMFSDGSSCDAVVFGSYNGTSSHDLQVNIT